MKREEVENKNLYELLDIINRKHGETRGNDLVAREAFRIVAKSLSATTVQNIKEEAAKRVLSGQEDREFISITRYDLIMDSATNIIIQECEL